MKLLTQDKDYNCGVYALKFFLGLYEYDLTIEYLEQRLKPDTENGTTHEAIKGVIQKCNFAYIEHYNSTRGFIDGHLPAIVNLQSDGDGHYVVFIGKIQNDLPGEISYFYYDPGDGELKTISEKDLDTIWYSKRYGNRWFCSINLNP